MGPFHYYTVSCIHELMHRPGGLVICICGGFLTKNCFPLLKVGALMIPHLHRRSHQRETPSREMFVLFLLLTVLFHIREFGLGINYLVFFTCSSSFCSYISEVCMQTITAACYCWLVGGGGRLPENRNGKCRVLVSRNRLMLVVIIFLPCFLNYAVSWGLSIALLLLVVPAADRWLMVKQLVSGLMDRFEHGRQ